jgi:prophage tail gpP-like protein
VNKLYEVLAHDGSVRGLVYALDGDEAFDKAQIEYGEQAVDVVTEASEMAERYYLSHQSSDAGPSES